MITELPNPDETPMQRELRTAFFEWQARGYKTAWESLEAFCNEHSRAERDALEKMTQQINPCERMRGTPNYACRWCYAFAPDPKQVHHSADCVWNNAHSLIRGQSQ